MQAQFIRHVHKRSRSLTGLDMIEFEKKLQAEAEKENVEPRPLLEQSLASLLTNVDILGDLLSFSRQF